MNSIPAIVVAHEVLSAVEQHKFATCETRIEERIKSIEENYEQIGVELRTIRDERLYRITHKTFEAYIESMPWGIRLRRAYQLIDLTKVMESLCTTVHKPTNEVQARELVPVPATERPAVMERAVEIAKGKQPTAKQIREAVKETKPKPATPQFSAGGTVTFKVSELPSPPPFLHNAGDFDEPIDEAIESLATPEPAKPKGQTRVNGVLQDDPPAMAELRAKGLIGEGTTPEVIGEPDEATSFADELAEQEERAAIQQADLSDDDYLEQFETYRKLTGTPKRTFRDDALAYRALERARKNYKMVVAKHANRARKQPPWIWTQTNALSRPGPAEWVKCPTKENGGCDGTGFVTYDTTTYECTRCKGHGYWFT